MNISPFIFDIFSDYTVRIIILGTTILGITSGVLGCFAVLKKQSLLGDAISHASLPGIAIAFILTGSKNTLVLFIGATIAGLLGTFWIKSITENTKIKSDSALGIVLSVFFGFGIVLLTFIQKIPNSNQAGLDKYLFGQAATILYQDVILMAIIGGLSVLSVILLWKEYKIITFDSEYALTLGINVKLIDTILTSTIVLSIILGLQTVGVVLMSAMLLAPAAAARQWTDRLGIMVILSAIFGTISGIFGTAISSSAQNISTGPIIIIVAVLIVIFSFIFAGNRGFLPSYLRKIHGRSNLNTDKFLISLYDMVMLHDNPYHLHSMNILKSTIGYNRKNLNKIISEQYIICDKSTKNWEFTEKGIDYTNSIIEHRGGE